MREVEIGIRIRLREGISFFGLEEVNGLIQQGAKVVAIQPGGALMEKLGEEGGNIRLTLTGCKMKVLLEGPAADGSRHNQLYKEACALTEGLIHLHDQPPTELDGAGRQRLERAIPLFQEVLQINPQNWSAMWLLGKVHQRLSDYAQALEYFTRAHRVKPDQPDVAREASIAAMDLGRAEEAVVFCKRALEAEPEDAGLRANLALALLFSGKPQEAAGVAEEALRRSPDDAITARIVAIIGEVLAGTRPCPRHIRDLE
jgi:tetratricopeptide (TPR) repeat protein